MTKRKKPGMEWPLAAAAAVLAFAASVGAQANYDRQAISITYEEEGLPLFGVLNGTVTELDDISSTIMLNKTRAGLNCSSGFMSVDMQFQGPFYGIVYADFDRNSACKIVGRGEARATIQLPLKGCGTLQSPARVFTNNIVVRFHPDLEIDGDEVITIICRYPPPIVPPPVIPAGLQLPPPVVVQTLQPLREFEILLIICAIIFLALMLLGLGCSYYCLKKRNIRVIRKRPASTLGSEVTKISEPISMFGGLKIPRAHAEDTSGSEELTESVRSEFPAELISTASEEDYTSAYSDAPFELAEGPVFPQLHAPPPPGFDIKMAIKSGGRPYSPVSSKASSESELILKAQEQYLTTILERTETNTLETLERVRRMEAGASGPPPVHARVRVVEKKAVSDNSEMESESEYSQATTDIQDFYHDRLELATAEQTNFTIDMKQQLVEDSDEGGRGRKPKGWKGKSKSKSKTKHRPPGYDNMAYQSQTVQEESTREDVTTSERYMAEAVRAGDRGARSSSAGGRERYSAAQDLITPVIMERATAHVNVRGQTPPRTNFDVLIRVLDNASVSAAEDDDVSSVLTEEERFRLREVIMQDESIRTILKESFTTEKILQLKDHHSIEKVIEPQKWDVLIRILDNAEVLSRADTSESKSSPQRSTVTGHEARSMSEVMVDFSNYGAARFPSGASSIYTQGARSTADRSGTEIVETDHYVINREAYFATSGSFHQEENHESSS